MKPEEPSPPAMPQASQLSPLQQSQQKIIAPLSSEESIRTAAATSLPPYETNPNSTQDTYGKNSGYLGSLVTEPLHSSHAAHHYSAVNAIRTQKTSSSGRTPRSISAVWKWIVLAVLLVGIGGYIYLTYFSSFVFARDLVQEKFQSTTYLRPRQWTAVNSAAGGVISVYGDKKGASGKSKALVLAQESAHQLSLSMTDANIQMVRTQFLDTVSQAALSNLFQGEGVKCATEVKVTKKADTINTDTLYGMYYFTASCDRTENGEGAEVHSHAVLGKDGLFRSISVMGTKTAWKQNEKTFDKILTSVNGA